MGRSINVHATLLHCVTENRKIHFSSGWAEPRRGENFFEMGILVKQLGNNYIRERNFEQRRKPV